MRRLEEEFVSNGSQTVMMASGPRSTHAHERASLQPRVADVNVIVNIIIIMMIEVITH